MGGGVEQIAHTCLRNGLLWIL